MEWRDPLWWRYRVGNPALNVLPTRVAYLAVNSWSRQLSIDAEVRRSICNSLSALGLDSEHTAASVSRAFSAVQSKVRLDDHRMAVSPEREVIKQIAYTDVAFLAEALSYGRGVILLTSHFGRLGMLAPALRGLGYQGSFLTATVDARAPSLTPMQRWIAHRNGTSVQKYLRSDWVMSEDSALKLRKILKRNEILIAVMDAFSSLSHERIAYPFLNGRIEVPTGILRLAELSGARLVYTLMNDNFAESVEMKCWSTNERPYEAISRAFSILGSSIRQCPGQWWLLPHLSAFWKK